MAPAPKGVQTFLEHWRGYVYAVTNGSSMGSVGALRLLRTSATPEGLANRAIWAPVVAGSDEAHLVDADVFDRYVVLYEMLHGTPRVRIIEHPRDGQVATPTQVDLLDEQGVSASTVYAGTNGDPAADTVRMSLAWPHRAERIVDVRLTDSNRLDRLDVAFSGLDTSAFVCSRVMVPSSPEALRVHQPVE